MGTGDSGDPPAHMDTKEAWNERDQSITVTEGNGFLYSLTLRAKVDSNPNDIYHVLTDPNTVSIFRSIKECTYRRVLEDDGKGRRMLEIGHRAISRFLFVNISFETHLHVWEDDNERTVKFKMARPGMMQKFDGCWRIHPFTQEALDSIYHPERLHPHPHAHLGPFNVSGLLSFLHHHKAPEVNESLVTLEQSLLPRGSVPPGLKGLVRGLCAHQIRCMMEDMRLELQRRKQGTSTTLKQQPKSAHTGAADSGAATDANGVGGGGNGTVSTRTAVAPAASLALAGRSLWGMAAPLHLTISL